ncbi:nuclear transport factor 2 family protein [Caldilinea sp.]|mgnify:CR=1 FL=1|uniref:nuclear transport factor 2 family protein n=1 Tax=Caldilinea sp. TaxID=2293560 RepID=UPI002B94AF2D|nr:hypothetical protein [Caldilinea sp.]HRA68108.1 hypothetical protein [Caldilinea sp.]
MSDIELKRSIDAWFAEYDAHSQQGDVEGMAEMAMFPLHVITDDGAGNGYTENWTRAQFVQTMTAAMQDTPPDLDMQMTRTPFFLTGNLVAVITDAVVTGGGQVYAMRYADILVKVDGQWKFQTMVQGGWGDMLKSQPA